MLGSSVRRVPVHWSNGFATLGRLGSGELAHTGTREHTHTHTHGGNTGNASAHGRTQYRVRRNLAQRGKDNRIMAKNETPVVVSASAFALGPATMDLSTVEKLSAQDYNARGVVLVNERVKFTRIIGDMPVEFTASLYVQRAAVGNDEAAKVTDAASSRKAKADEKAKAEAEKLAAEKRAMFQLGQESTIGAIRNVDALARGLQFVQNIASKADAK